MEPSGVDRRQAVRYERWVERYRGRLYSLFVRLSGEAELAADLTQECLLAAWRGLPAYRGEARPYTWLHTIAINTWRQHTRARTPTDEPLDDGLPAAAPGPEGVALCNGFLSQVDAALAALPGTYREALLLHKVQGLSCRETAAALAVPVGTVKWRVHEGLELLRRRLEDDPCA